MILALAYSDRDLVGALRLMRWVGWLSEQNGNSMLGESVVLIGSKRAARYEKHNELCWLAARIFREARSYVPEEEHETGWPGAANFMFKQTLEHVERYFHEDVLFLEPDGVPIVPDWFDRMRAEWESVAKPQGKDFMGAYVPHTTPHMTGIAVYGARWRDLAPMLVQSPDHDAFDCYGAGQVLPHCHLTPLIQHVFRRHDPGWCVPSVGILDPRAVLFHQCKRGKLIAMLDQTRYNGDCAQHPLFGYAHLCVPQKTMRKFYYTGNSTKAVVAHGQRFVFNPLEPFGGAIPGALVSDIESEQVALSDLTSNPTTGVTEISEAEWEQLTKKKLPLQNSSTFEPLNGISPKAVVYPTPSKSPAVLVAEPVSAVSDAAVRVDPTIKDINDVLKTGPVTPSQPVMPGPKSGRPRKPVSTDKP